MSVADSERKQRELLQALSQAREYVRWLEGIAARNAALLGEGVDFGDQVVNLPPPETGALRAALQALGMDVGGEDLSNYLGIEGHEESRPRLTDAPDSLKPAAGRGVGHGIGMVAVEPVEAFLPLPGVPVESPPLVGAASLPGAEIVLDPVLRTVESVRPVFDVSSSGIDSSLLEEAPTERDSLLPGPDFSVPGSPEAAPGDAARPFGIAPGGLTPDPAEDVFLHAVLALWGDRDGIWDWNIRTGAVRVSSRWREFLGPQEDSGLLPLEALACSLDPADVPAFFAACDGLLAGKLLRISLTPRFHRPSGGRFRGQLRAVCLRRNGKAVRLTAVLTAPPRKGTAAS
jgi:PAS domain-containing protein